MDIQCFHTTFWLGNWQHSWPLVPARSGEPRLFLLSHGGGMEFKYCCEILSPWNETASHVLPWGSRLGHLFWLCAMKVIQWITNVWVSNQENEKRWQNLSLCWVWADGTTWPPYRSDQAAVRQHVRDQKGNTQMWFCRNSLMYLFFTFAERLSTYGFVYSAGIFINK